MEIAKFDESPIQDEKELAALHFSTVEKLKRALVMGQANFLAAGKYLYDIKTNDLYKYEDASVETTWQDFLSRPDIPLPGSTQESRLRVANTLVRVYRTFKVDHQVEDSKLAEIGWTKLDVLAGHIANNPTMELSPLLETAKELTVKDLQAELKTGTMEETLNCEHLDTTEYVITKCNSCHTTIKKT